jgi:diguanylate cyclase (GGDEF)-like protein
VLFTFAIVATLVTFGLLVVLGRAELRERRPVRASAGPIAAEGDARDPREALALVGNALAATHDTSGLLPVILDVTVEATGASGGRVLDDDRELARVGVPAGEDPIELELGESTSGGEIRLLVDPPQGGFSPDSAALAEWLASQASIALENARLHQVVRKQALTDELTGLVNRRRFVEVLEGEITRAGRLKVPLSILFADLDDFKRLNDRFGHAAGDEALRTFAELLRAQLRGIDTAARMGGEEFAVLLPGTELEGAVVVAERIRLALAEQASSREQAGGTGLTTSIGVVQYRTGTSGDLLRRADAALYSAKEQGKNRVVGDASA